MVENTHTLLGREIMILDSSVIFKWFFDEEGTDRALAILQDIQKEKISMFAPRLLFYEIGNSLLYHKPFTEDKIKYASKILEELSFSFYDFTFQEWNTIIDEAHHYNISFYDYSYLFLAKQLNTQLITADTKLFKKNKNLGFVKLL